MKSQLMCLARLYRTHQREERTPEHFTLLGKGYPLKGLGSRLEQRNTCLVCTPHIGPVSHLTTHTRVTFKTYRTSFARPCKWKNNTKTIAIKWWAMTFMKQSVKPLHRQVNSI